MAVTFLNTTTKNADGLTIQYGVEEARASNAGEYKTFGEYRMIELSIPDLTLLSATEANAMIIDRHTFLPAGAYVRKVVVVTKVEPDSSGNGAKLNVGTVKRDTTTEGDFNGILDSLAETAIDSTDKQTVILNNASGGGALFHASSGTDAGGYYICASAETEVFTAGSLKLQIFFDFVA